jgi:glycosyltransferase involved in cell wall biosynthesis
MCAIRVLHDGWPLLHAPTSAAAWHLRTLLELAPVDTELILALPAEKSVEGISNNVKIVRAAQDDRGAWEQGTLPRLAEEHGANWIHTTNLAASLFGKTPTLVSPTSSVQAHDYERGLRGRLAAAQGWGGLARATILWPEDLPAPRLPGKIITLPPVAHPAFIPKQWVAPTELGLPEEYLLYHGASDEPTLLRLLESWTWAAASIGELYPLVMLGLDQGAKDFLEKRLPEFHVQDSVQILPEVSFNHLPALYQNSAAIVHAGAPTPWGGALRYALACGKAVVAQQEPLTEAIVGSAAYLVAPEDLRSFGAAIITMVVDEKARESLEAAARQRSDQWEAAAFTAGLSKIYLGET